MKQMSLLDRLFDNLWKQYTVQNPAARQIYDLFSGRGESVVNDHIAFRTFNDPRIGIDVLAEGFKRLGYVEKGSYKFEDKHLSARHYETDSADLPRIFISELLLEDFSDFLRSEVAGLIDGMDKELFNSEDLVFSGNVFGAPSYKIYEKMRLESEYAAWLYVYGFRANHFTISVNSLQTMSGIEEVNDFLKSNGFELNTSGGEIKGSREQLLRQSSTKAEKTDIVFQEGTFSIPACYYEFAERFPAKGGQLFSGFIAGSADKIFESTDFYEKK